MSKLIWIELAQPEQARLLAEALESDGVHAAPSRTLRGRPEVRIEKPVLRRMSPFISEVESIVRRWLQQEAPDIPGLVAQTFDGRFEIRRPKSDGVAQRTRSAAAASASWSL